MTWLAIKLFMGKALERLLGLFKLAMAHPWQAACIGLVCVSVWLWRADSRHVAERDAARATIADMTAKAKQARASSVTIAKESDKAHETRVADNRTATVRYIDSHRVRPQACPATSEVEDTRLPEQTPAPAIVAVSEADVQICATNYSYALSAYEWAAKLREQGLAD